MSPKPSNIRPVLQEQSQRRPQAAQPLQKKAAPPQPMDALGRAAANPASARPAQILALQSHFGNRAVQRLLSSRALQTKLNVGPAGDSYEQEADQVADQVMAGTGAVQGRGGADDLQAKPEDVQRQETNGVAFSGSTSLATADSTSLMK